MLIKVKVFPGAKKSTVFKKTEDSFDVYVKALPKQGEATRETIWNLAVYFNIPATKIFLVKGAKTRNKIFEIKDLL